MVRDWSAQRILHATVQGEKLQAKLAQSDIDTRLADQLIPELPASGREATGKSSSSHKYGLAGD